MQKQIETLVKLQTIKTDIRTIRTDLDEVARRLGEWEAQFESRNTAFSGEKARLEAMQKTYRTYEADTQTLEARIQRSQERLGAVKTNKEYTSTLKEIDELRASQSKIEDEMIAFLDQMDDTEGKIQEEKVKLAAFEKEVEREREKIQQASAANREKLAGLEEDWGRVSREVSPEMMDLFTKVRARVGDIAIVPVRKAVCQGCHVNIPPQMFNELQRCDSIKFCPNCQRIIYWADPDVRPE